MGGGGALDKRDIQWVGEGLWIRGIFNGWGRG